MSRDDNSVSGERVSVEITSVSGESGRLEVCGKEEGQQLLGPSLVYSVPRYSPPLSSLVWNVPCIIGRQKTFGMFS